MKLRNGKVIGADHRDDQCNICFRIKYMPRVLYPCDHSFCSSCVKGVFYHNRKNDRNDRCPFCRRIIIDIRHDEDLTNRLKRQYPIDYNERRADDKRYQQMERERLEEAEKRTAESQLDVREVRPIVMNEEQQRNLIEFLNVQSMQESRRFREGLIRTSNQDQWSSGIVGIQSIAEEILGSNEENQIMLWQEPHRIIREEHPRVSNGEQPISTGEEPPTMLDEEQQTMVTEEEEITYDEEEQRMTREEKKP